MTTRLGGEDQFVDELRKMATRAVPSRDNVSLPRKSLGIDTNKIVYILI